MKKITYTIDDMRSAFNAGRRSQSIKCDDNSDESKAYLYDEYDFDAFIKMYFELVTQTQSDIDVSDYKKMTINHFYNPFTKKTIYEKYPYLKYLIRGDNISGTDEYGYYEYYKFLAIDELKNEVFLYNELERIVVFPLKIARLWQNVSLSSRIAKLKNTELNNRLSQLQQKELQKNAR